MKPDDPRIKSIEYFTPKASARTVIVSLVLRGGSVIVSTHSTGGAVTDITKKFARDVALDSALYQADLNFDFSEREKL